LTAFYRFYLWPLEDSNFQPKDDEYPISGYESADVFVHPLAQDGILREPFKIVAQDGILRELLHRSLGCGLRRSRPGFHRDNGPAQ